MEYRYLTLYWCVGPGIGSLHRCMVNLQDKLPRREMRVQNRLPIFQYFYVLLGVTKS